MSAKDTVVPFGKFRGMTIDEIAKTDDGLRWLDWATDVVESPRLLKEISDYLKDPSIARDLERALDSD